VEVVVGINGYMLGVHCIRSVFYGSGWCFVGHGKDSQWGWWVYTVRAHLQ